jgi:hypothetical protein
MSSASTRRIVVDRLRSEEVQQVCRVLMRVAEALGGISPDMTVVGGLVPVLLIDQEQTEEGFEAHAGTRDLDLGLDLALAEARLLPELGALLAGCGLVRDSLTRWSDAALPGVKVDLLVPASDKAPPRTSLRIAHGVEATAVDGLDFAFRQPVPVVLSAATGSGSESRCTVYCCGPAAYVLLKTTALTSRQASKDAYDMVYVLRFWPGGPQDIAQQLAAWTGERAVAEVTAKLRECFADYDSSGPELYVKFYSGRTPGIPAAHRGYLLRAEAHAAVLQLLRELDASLS